MSLDQRESSANGRRYSVLIADDEPDIVEEIAFRYEIDGYRVLSAHSGNRAWEIAQAEHPDLIVTDIRMPDGSGSDLINRLHASNSELPVIFCMSAFSDFPLSEAFEKGVDVVFSKPFDIKDLMSASKRFLGVRQTIRDIRCLANDLNGKLLKGVRLAGLGEMGSFVSHEINNLLDVIATRAQVLEILLSENAVDLSEGMRAVQVIRSSSSRMAGLIKGVRAMTLDLTSDPIEDLMLGTFLREVLGFCAQKCVAEGIDLFLGHVPAGLRLRCHPGQLRQAIVHLLANSCDAVRNCPEKWVQVSVMALESELRIAVTDSGEGIRPELRKKVFEPFFTTKDREKHAGLGLSLVKRVAALHGASVEIDPAGEVMRMILSFPLKKRSTKFASFL